MSVLDPDRCYRSLTARDRRFDGVFYVGVTTTGVYCRPICPARTPARTRCRFFHHAAEAERAGFRACLRCRPELAPGLAPVDAVPRLVRTALASIEAGALNDGSLEDLATSLEVSARHLRRAFEAELGVAPVDLAQSRRLALAKRLIADTSLSLADVAFASGFGSVRRMNAVFKERFGRPPSSLRRGSSPSDTIALRLEYRPPYDFDRLLTFVAPRTVPGIDAVADGEYRRHVSFEDVSGEIAVRADPSRPALVATISSALLPRLMELVHRLSALFDLSARPDLIAAELAARPELARSLERRPGLRIPGAFDAFEAAIRIVLGQQVSVAAASTLANRLVTRFGRELEGRRAFPRPESLAERSDAEIREIGLPLARAGTVRRLAEAVALGKLRFGRGAPEETIARLREIPGIGPWTADFIAMRVEKWPDAFPAGDLVLRRAIGAKNARAAEDWAEPLRPWRAYAAMHLWSANSEGDRS